MDNTMRTLGTAALLDAIMAEDAKMTAAENVIAADDARGNTYSFVAKPYDDRCHWWCRIGTPAAVRATDPANVGGASDLPGAYLRKGTDLELPVWTMIFHGEANHRAKNRGWTHRLGIVVPDGDGLRVAWLTPGEKMKAIIKASGAKEIMGGSGQTAAMLRVARWVASGETTGIRWERCWALGIWKARQVVEP